MTQPLAIDLFCGLGGWTDGLLAAGYYVVGFDIIRHDHDGMRYPGQIVIQDVSALHGAQFKDAALIVASPPCQEYSYMSLPFRLGKEKERAILADESGEKLAELTFLFRECYRIQAEACRASGRHIPLVVENVRGAQKFVGRARWNFGAFYLWGDVPALMPIRIGSAGVKCGGDWFNADRPSISRTTSYGSRARAAAVAKISKIPFELSHYIGKFYAPH